jgi:MFS-type transporter involved in bile tolerance (Atg22 family)
VFKDDLRTIIRNKNYLIIFLAITFVFGDLSIIFVFMPWITKTYHYATVSNGIIIASSNIVGCLACVLISTIGKRFTYKQKCTFLSIGLIFSMAFLWLTL